MLPRIYYGSRYLYMSQIKESFPDANFIFIDNIDKQLASYSPFFDLNNIYLYDNPNTETITVGAGLTASHTNADAGGGNKYTRITAGTGYIAL